MSARMTAVLLLAATTVLADVPEKLEVKGRLTTSGGAPVTTPTEITWRSFPESSGGTDITSVTTTVTPGPGGGFSFPLPAPRGADMHRLFWDEGIVSGDTPFAPRKPSTAAPHALRARRAAGLALRNTITLDALTHGGAGLQAAIDGISDATFGNEYLILLGPGYWQVGAGLMMKDHVHVRGVDRGAVVLFASGFPSSSSAVVTMTEESSLENLTVECNAGGTMPRCVGVLFDGASGTLRDVKVHVSNFTDQGEGVSLRGSGTDPDLFSVEISVETTAGEAYGLLAQNSAEAFVVDGDFRASASDTFGIALAGVFFGSSRITARNTEFFAEGTGSGAEVGGLQLSTSSSENLLVGGLVGADCSAGTTPCRGLRAQSNAEVTLQGGLVIVIAEGTGARAVEASGGAEVHLLATRVDADRGGASDEVGLHATGTGSVVALAQGSLAAATAAETASSGAVRLGVARVAGDVSDPGLTCFDTHDEDLLEVSCGP